MYKHTYKYAEAPVTEFTTASHVFLHELSTPAIIQSMNEICDVDCMVFS